MVVLFLTKHVVPRQIKRRIVEISIQRGQSNFSEDLLLCRFDRTLLIAARIADAATLYKKRTVNLRISARGANFEFGRRSRGALIRRGRGGGGGRLFNFSQIVARRDHFSDNYLRINTNISCLLTENADPKVNIAALLYLTCSKCLLNMFTN